MLSSVVIYGKLGPKINSRYRWVHCQQTDALVEQEVNFDIPVVYWTTSTNNLLMIPKDDTNVIIRGRLGKGLEDNSVCVICEMIQVVTPNLEAKAKEKKQ